MKIVQVGEISGRVNSILRVNIQFITEATISTEKPDNSAYLLGTGVTDYTKKNNIYDLAGNYQEWTTESDSSGNRVGRGR